MLYILRVGCVLKPHGAKNTKTLHVNLTWALFSIPVQSWIAYTKTNKQTVLRFVGWVELFLFFLFYSFFKLTCFILFLLVYVVVVRICQYVHVIIYRLSFQLSFDLENTQAKLKMLFTPSFVSGLELVCACTDVRNCQTATRVNCRLFVYGFVWMHFQYILYGILHSCLQALPNQAKKYDAFVIYDGFVSV